MKRRTLSVLLAAGMVASMLAGCGGAPDQGGTPSGDGSNVSNSSESSGNNEGSGSDASGETYEVAIQLVNIAPELPDLEAVEAAVNEITVPAINCTVDIQNIFIGDLPTTTSMNVVSDEKIDLVAVGLTQKLADIYDDGILLPLDDYLQYAPTYVEAVGNVMPAGQVNGVQYAIPSNPYVARGAGFAYNKDMADELGIKLEDGMALEDLTDVFAKVKEKDAYGTSYGTASSLTATMWFSGEAFGTNADFGYIADPDNSTTIENFYASDDFRRVCVAAKEWVDAGYIPSDSLTDTTTVQEYFSMHRVFGTVTAYDIAQIGIWQQGQDFTVDIVEMADPVVSTSAASETMWGIAANSKNPQKAMELLELIYTNKDLGNLLMFGIEGVNYTIVEGTENVCTPDGSEHGTDGYTSIFTKYGDTTQIFAKYPNTDNYVEDVKAYNDGVAVSKSLGYVFDSSEFSAEAGAISNVIAEYLPRLQTGMVDDVDAAIDEMVAALENAGMSDVIAENQRQLDAFMQQ